MMFRSSLPAEIQTFGYKNFQTDLCGMILFPCFNLMLIENHQQSSGSHFKGFLLS